MAHGGDRKKMTRMMKDKLIDLRTVIAMRSIESISQQQRTFRRLISLLESVSTSNNLKSAFL